MMRRVFGLIMGILLFFPGALILRWLVVDELGIYQEMTLTDALLAIIIILAGALIFGQSRRPLTADEIQEQAKQMELASRRLQQAQEKHARALRAKKSSRRASSRQSSASRRSSSRQPPPTSRRSRSSRSSRSERTDRWRYR
jgi:type II secretory pathway pseudopilin PulG